MDKNPAPLRLVPSPASLDQDAFVARFGAIYEHSPWVARDAYRNGLDDSHDEPGVLAAAMSRAMRAADRASRLALIRAHPDLAGKAAKRGQLTAESTAEQAGAGIDQCTAEEFVRFEALNSAYLERFGFPFVMAVKGSDRHQILAAFEIRLANDPQAEFEQALEQIDRIARWRLEAMARPAV